MGGREEAAGGGLEKSSAVSQHLQDTVAHAMRQVSSLVIALGTDGRPQAPLILRSHEHRNQAEEVFEP